EKPDKETLKKRLTPLEYTVTQENGTEPPFQNEYWDNDREGIYVDIISGNVLLSSQDKFDARCGWPSFTKPVGPYELVDKTDTSQRMIRTEISSRQSDAQLRHGFTEGPTNK